MGLTISNLFNRLFGKKQMRILMGKLVDVDMYFVSGKKGINNNKHFEFVVRYFVAS